MMPVEPLLKVKRSASALEPELSSDVTPAGRNPQQAALPSLGELLRTQLV